jgi:cobalt-zinc-cadmium efflux system outer membrane protein
VIRIVFFFLLSSLATWCHGAEPVRPLTLGEAERLLLQNNPDLAMGRATLAGMDAGIASADVLPNPQISLSSTGISRQEGIGSNGLTQKRKDTVLRLDQQWEWGGKRELRVASARAGAQAAEQDQAALIRQQRISLAGAFYDLLAAQERQMLAQEIAGFARRSAEVARLRLAAGDLARVDLARALTDAARAEGDTDMAEADQGHAQLALAQMIALDTDASSLRAVGDWPKLETPSVRNLAELLASRPDVAAARDRAEAARSARDLARAQRTRDVGVGLQVERNPATAPGNLVGVSVSVPLFLGNGYRGDIAKAESDYTLALETQRKTKLAAEAELNRQRLDVETLARRARRLREDLLPEAKRAASAAEFAFAQGAMGIGDLLDARRSLKAAEQDVIASQADYAKALQAWRLQGEEK